MARLKTLKPRLAQIATQRIPTERLRGRAGMERRARWLRDNPLCVHCEAEGRVSVATVPDHIVALTNGGQDTEENLQSLCAEHHRIKTAKDLGYTPKPTIGKDGWPVA